MIVAPDHAMTRVERAAARDTASRTDDEIIRQYEAAMKEKREARG